MQILQFPLHSYFRHFFKKVDYELFDSFIEKMKNHGFNEYYIRVFCEYSFISYATQKKVYLGDDVLEQIHNYWATSVSQLEYYRFAEPSRLNLSHAKAIQKMYDALANDEIEIGLFSSFVKLVADEKAIAPYRLSYPKSLPEIQKNFSPLYGGEPATYLKPFISLDANILRGNDYVLIIKARGSSRLFLLHGS